MNRHETKSCPRCSVLFECKPGNITQCGCYGMVLTLEQKCYMELHYNDCLCRSCLEQIPAEWQLFQEKYILR